MIQCIYNPNILLIISQYLPLKDIVSISILDKTVYKKFDPDKLPQLNLLYRLEFYKLYYDEDVKRVSFSSDYNNKNDYENLLGDFKISKQNWKKMFTRFYNNLRDCPDLKHGKLIYDFFKDHLYLPDLRKENKYLEFQSSTIHQKLCYDLLLFFRIRRNYYAKFFDPENNNQQIVPRNKNLPLENEVINFKVFANDFENNNEYKNIILKLINYNFDELNNIYNKNKYNNNFIQLILWINSTIIIFVKVLYEFVIINNKQKNEKKFLIEFISKHNDFINFALLLNKKFENINVIVNLVYSYQITKKERASFSLYKLCIEIYKNYFYKNIDNVLLERFDIYVKNYFDTQFEKIAELMINGKLNDSKQYFDDDIEMSIDDENEFKSFDGDNLEYLYTDKQVLEEAINHVLDNEINEMNAHLINHTDIKLSITYKRFEGIIIRNFINKVVIYLKEEKPLSIIYRIIKYFITLTDSYMPLKEENPLSLLRRTKLLILHECVKILVEYIKNNLYTDFENYMKNMGDKINCEKYGLNEETLNYLSEKSKKTCIENYEKEINEIRNLLTNKYKNHQEVINLYINTNCNEFICSMKNIIAFYFTQLANYKDRNEIVVDLIKNGYVVKNTKCLREGLDKDGSSNFSKNELKNEETGQVGFAY